MFSLNVQKIAHFAQQNPPQCYFQKQVGDLRNATNVAAEKAYIMVMSSRFVNIGNRILSSFL